MAVDSSAAGLSILRTSATLFQRWAWSIPMDQIWRESSVWHCLELQQLQSVRPLALNAIWSLLTSSSSLVRHESGRTPSLSALSKYALCHHNVGKCLFHVLVVGGMVGPCPCCNGRLSRAWREGGAQYKHQLNSIWVPLWDGGMERVSENQGVPQTVGCRICIQNNFNLFVHRQCQK